MSDTGNTRTPLEEGLDYAGADMYEEAIHYLTLAIEQGLDEEDEEEARRWRSTSYGQSGHVKEALIDADWLIERGYEDKYAWRAHLKFRLEDYEGAIADYTHEIARDPNYGHGDLYDLRGRCYLHTGQYEKAVADFSTLLSQTDIPILRELAAGRRGIAYVELGDYQRGIDDFQQAVDIAGFEPHLTDWYFHRGLAREHFGDLEGAIKDYRRAIIDPKHPQAAHVQKLLDSLD